MNAEVRIRQYISDTFFFGDPSELDADDSLLEAGIIDSTGVMELVLFLESSFGLEVLDEDLVPENLDTVSRISDYVLRKTSDRAGKS